MKTPNVCAIDVHIPCKVLKHSHVAEEFGL